MRGSPPALRHRRANGLAADESPEDLGHRLGGLGVVGFGLRGAAEGQNGTKASKGPEEVPGRGLLSKFALLAALPTGGGAQVMTSLFALLADPGERDGLTMTPGRRR